MFGLEALTTTPKVIYQLVDDWEVIRELVKQLEMYHDQLSGFTPRDPDKYYAEAFEKTKAKAARQQPNNFILVAFVGEKAVGYCRFSYDTADKYGTVHGFIVDSDFRNQGIGKQLMLQSLDYMRKKLGTGAPVWLTAMKGNDAAIKTYERLGFRIVSYHLQYDL